jgi:hypothetical protein
MNDTELDELLDAWTAPPAPVSLRERARAGFAANLECTTPPGVRYWIVALVPGARKRLVAGAILAAAAFFLVVALALPQTQRLVSFPAGVPYMVDSEVVQYAQDGSASVDMYSSSYSLNGHEVLLSRSLPGNRLGTAIGRILDATLPLLFRLRSSFTVDAELLEKVKRAAAQSVTVTTGCSGTCLLLAHYGFARAAGAGCLNGEMVGRETILTYPTVAVRPSWGWGNNQRMTLWMAPELECFALRITIEEKRPDGTYRLVTKKQALKVTLNHSAHGTRNSNGGL